MNKNIVEDLLRGSLWETPPVVDQPTVHLVRWRVLEVRNRDLELECHFVGYNAEGREGRVSTAIRHFDPTTSRGVTKSGRVYQLIGPPGYDSDGAWVWHHWSRLNGMTDEKDVTAEVLSSMQAG